MDEVKRKVMPGCPRCGNNRQVWKNQITGKLTCHRAYCHTVIGDEATGKGKTE